MITFLKAQVSFILGSVVDFGITILLAEGFHCWYILANAAGNISGSITQFFLCRGWAFEPGKGKMIFQVMKFILVWMGNIILSGCGVYLFTHFLGWNYLLSKTFTSVLLGLTYNYILQKKFVFV
jgi:putative flippase GtrA